MKWNKGTVPNVLICCVVLLTLFVATKKETAKEIQATEEFDFKNFEEYRTITPDKEEYPNSIKVIFIVPYDATPAEVNAHVHQTIESLRAEDPDLFSAHLLYYEHPLSYECEDTPVVNVQWGPQGSLNNKANGIELGDYSRHAIAFCYYPYDVSYALTAEEWDLYHKLQTYFLDEVGHPPYHVSDPAKIPDEAAAYKSAATALGCTSRSLMDLQRKVMSWRPSDIESVYLPE